MIKERESYLQVSAPLRLSIAGGGTDLPEWYRSKPAHLLSVALGFRIRVTVQTRSEATVVDSFKSELVQLFEKRNPSATVIAIDSEVSPGSGLGGSGALAVALVAAELELIDGVQDPEWIALEAYRWERELLGNSVGFQDQSVAALGSCVEMNAAPGEVISLKTRPDLLSGLARLRHESLILVGTDRNRKADSVLADLAKNLTKDPVDSVGGLVTVAEAIEVISLADGQRFGELLRRHWKAKLELNPHAATPEANEILELAHQSGQFGGKLVGAGGGGYVLLSGASIKKPLVVKALESSGYGVSPFFVSPNGVEVEIS